MKRKHKNLLLAFLISPFMVMAQFVQIGNDINGSAPMNAFGWSVALNADGTVLAVGAPFNDDLGQDVGLVNIYLNTGGNWSLVGNSIYGEGAMDLSGASVALNANGNIVAIGAFLNDGGGQNSGHVRVFQNNSGSWSQIGQDLDGLFAFEEFGTGISINANGDRLAIGAPGLNNTPGRVRVYENNSGTWTQIGSDIVGTNINDRFGVSVNLNEDGTVLAIASDFDDYVQVYEEISGNWVQRGSTINGISSSVRLNSDGTLVAAATISTVNGLETIIGRVYEFSQDWTQAGNDLEGATESNYIGNQMLDMNSDGSLVALGAPGSFFAPHTVTGSVQLFENLAGTWTALDSIEGEEIGDNEGSSVSLSSNGTILATGAQYSDSNGFDSGQVRVFDGNLLGLTSFEISPDDILLYPNPADNVLNISSQDATIQTVSIRNVQGQLIKNFAPQGSSDILIDVSNLSTGIYIVELRSEKNLVSKRFIKR